MRIGRREFLAGAALSAAHIAVRPLFSGEGQLDILIRGGLMVDGSGDDPEIADIGIKDGRILAIEQDSKFRAYRTIDARGLIVAPGFIDIHSHSDYTLIRNGEAHSKIRQGVTTEIVGQDGRSPAPITDLSREYFRSLYGFNPGWVDFDGYYRAILYGGSSVNLRSMVGAGMLRAAVAGMEKRPITGEELERMKFLYRAAQNQGAMGISSGLEYLPGSYATEAELAALARFAGRYSTHTRNEGDYVLEAMDEAIRITKKAGVPLHINHLKAQGRRNHGKLPRVLMRMDEARSFFSPVTCDMYPFRAYASRLITLFPEWSRGGGEEGLKKSIKDPHDRFNLRVGVERKVESIGNWSDIIPVGLNSESWNRWNTVSIGEIATRLRTEPFTVLRRMILDGQANRSMVVFAMEEDNIQHLIRYPWCAFASDGAAISKSNGYIPHPRNFGTYPLILGKYVRDKGLISIQEAVRKMTSLPAKIAGIEKRGLLEEGYFADLVIFNGDKVRNMADYGKSDYPKGIEHVIVNGEIVIDQGDHTGIKSGKIV